MEHKGKQDASNKKGKQPAPQKKEEKQKINKAILPKWKERTEKTHSEIVSSLTSGGTPPDVVFLGDSMFERWKTTGSICWRHSGFSHYNICNAGIGGDCTQHVLWRLDQTPGVFDYVKPKCVFLLIGTNNIESDSPEDITEAINLICQRIFTQSPASKIVLLGVFPRKGDQKLHDRIRQLNALLEALAGEKITYRYYGDLMLTIDGKINNAYFDDRVHLNENGYYLWGQHLLQTLNG